MEVKAVPIEDMYKAFSKSKAAGDYKLDELRFTEFQRGWRAALEWVNTASKK